MKFWVKLMALNRQIKNPDDEINNEDVMKQVKEIVTDENIAILKGAIDLLEKQSRHHKKKIKRDKRIEVKNII